MRENIGLFRGKRKDNGEWIYGNLLRWGDEAYMVGMPDIVYFDVSNIFRYGAELDPDTIGECTGVKANGKWIFEGDIITCYRFGGKWYESLPVEWDEMFGGWHTPGCHSLYQGYGFEYEIIGNVTDNPELLKGGEG